MARLGKAFNPNEHQAFTPREPLPPQWYAMRVVKSEVRKNKGNDDGHLWLELEIDERYHPTLKSRCAWDRLNLWNHDAQTVQIANSKLTAISKSVGLTRPFEDSEEIHGKTLAVKLRIRKGDGNFEDSNDVTGYEPVASRFPGSSVGPSQTPPPPAGGQMPGQTAPAQNVAPAAAQAPQTPPWGGG